MPAKIIDGKKIAEGVREDLKNRLADVPLDKRPGLAVVLAGDDPASKVYVGQKEKISAELGLNSFVFRLPDTATQNELTSLINKLNDDPKVNGVLVQLPLPQGLDSGAILSAIDPDKDADGFHVVNVGRLWTGKKTVEPCTPKGIMVLLDSTGLELKGKEAVVIGRSNIVGKPISAMLLSRHCTVTICHSRTKDLKEVTKRADIVIAAIGKPRFVTEDMVKQGAIVIDVGINRVDGKLTGDVDFAGVSKAASWITPVPGGVGPMTIVMLMRNTLRLAGLKID
jgi:methylenetetrahydrofolate dehydrogenase (NADP+)/methenyltetrahydrofolate cyclohydrolase